MNLAETVYLMVQKSMKSAQLTDLRVGTVTSVGPLEITMDPAMPPIPSSILYLTEAVVEKKIPVLAHSHEVKGLGHSHSVTGLSHQHSTGGLTHTHDITGLSHTHTLETGATGSALGGSYTSGDALRDTYTSDTQLAGAYPTTSALGGVESTSALGGVACVENGITLPVENGYIILNRALKVGDMVLLLRVQSGQKFVVLSRIFEEVT